VAKLYPETRKKYYLAHKEKTLAYRKQHHIDNKDRAHELNRLWRLNNKDKIFESNLRNAHHMTLEEYNQMFEDQKGCCAICGKHQSELKHTLHVDHNHETGLIRALLCKKCNSLIGYADEDINILKNAIEYLKK
jgi:hypothetical protein